ncbi:hypothetical protein HYR69_05635, partial [Candidatus Sumerlaeota bacterium]|nr:hypothetical protein [Candidatus Sumerlaeota bacterium]
MERGFESEDPRLLWHVVLLLGYPEVRTPKNKERLLQILETATDWPLVSSATNEIGVFECSSAELPRIIEAAKTIDRRCGSLHPPELEDNLLNHAAGAVGEAAYLPLREYIGARATAHKRREFWQEDERILLSTRHPQAIREVLSDLKEKKLVEDTPHHHRGPVDWIFGEVK